MNITQNTGTNKRIKINIRYEFQRKPKYEESLNHRTTEINFLRNVPSQDTNNITTIKRKQECYNDKLKINNELTIQKITN